jgi:ribosomal protein L37AE/L43A
MRKYTLKRHGVFDRYQCPKCGSLLTMKKGKFGTACCKACGWTGYYSECMFNQAPFKKSYKKEIHNATFDR